MNVDLHVHTTSSDGTDTPREVVVKAKSNGLAAVAITDHDTVGGIAEAMNAGAELGIEVIPGIEISADYCGSEVHILGYYIDIDSTELKPALDWTVNERDRRNAEIITKMQSAGIDVTIEKLRKISPDGIIGRPHFARFLMNVGVTRSIAEGFEKYIGKGMPFYVPRKRFGVMEAVWTILRAGGVPALAHPGIYGYNDNEVEALVDYLVGFGLRGVEAIYTEHTKEYTDKIISLAQRKGLIYTGGSDYHGANKPDISLGIGKGDLAVGYDRVEELKRICEEVRNG